MVHGEVKQPSCTQVVKVPFATFLLKIDAQFNLLFTWCMTYRANSSSIAEGQTLWERPFLLGWNEFGEVIKYYMTSPEVEYNSSQEQEMFTTKKWRQFDWDKQQLFTVMTLTSGRKCPCRGCRAAWRYHIHDRAHCCWRCRRNNPHHY